MFGDNMLRHDAGDIEILDAEKTKFGLKVHVKGLSPFAISYEEIDSEPEFCPECGTELNADGTCSNAANHNKPPVDDPTDPPASDDNNKPDADKPEAEKTDKETSVQTGDDMNMFAYGAAMILAMAGAAAALHRRREN